MAMLAEQPRGQRYDQRLSSELSKLLRHGGSHTVQVRADGFAHLDDVSEALAKTPDEIMHVVLLSSKHGELRFEHVQHDQHGTWIRALSGHSGHRRVIPELLRLDPLLCFSRNPPAARPRRTWSSGAVLAPPAPVLVVSDAVLGTAALVAAASAAGPPAFSLGLSHLSDVVLGPAASVAAASAAGPPAFSLGVSHLGNVPRSNENAPSAAAAAEPSRPQQQPEPAGVAPAAEPPWQQQQQPQQQHPLPPPPRASTPTHITAAAAAPPRQNPPPPPQPLPPPPPQGKASASGAAAAAAGTGTMNKMLRRTEEADELQRLLDEVRAESADLRRQLDVSAKRIADLEEQQQKKLTGPQQWLGGRG